MISTMDSGGYYKISKFNGKNNFILWKVKVQAVLKQKGVYDVVFEPDQLAKELTEPKKRDMEMKAHSAIQLALSYEVHKGSNSGDNCCRAMEEA